jgi:S1-C subfamily serine protease
MKDNLNAAENINNVSEGNIPAFSAPWVGEMFDELASDEELLLKRIKRGVKAGLIAVVLACCLIFGGLGSGFMAQAKDTPVTQSVEAPAGGASLGLSTQEITGRTARFFRTEAGLYVSAITSGGASDETGIKPGDRIVSLDGRTIASAVEFKAVEEKHLPGDTLEVLVSRDGRNIRLIITLREKL